MLGSTPMGNPRQRPAIWPAGLIVIYFAWLVMTPYSRFPVLTEIRFERILMAIGWLMVMFSGRLSAPNKIVGAYMLLFIWMYVSLFLSPYPGLNSVEEWQDSYWKLAVLFFLIFFSLRDVGDLRRFSIGAALVLFAYEAYSLVDFVAGGSYVWQQGVRRAVGVWSRKGLGAPNFFGLIGVFLVPFALFYMLESRSRWRRALTIAMLLTGSLAILLSGTRAALVTSLALLFVFYRSSLRRFKSLIVWGGIVAFALSFLSADMRERYISIIPGFDSGTTGVASRSAQSRVAGLRDGWQLFLKRPIAGYGPETSGYARLEVSEFTAEPLQLHSLYGQVMGELGVLGALVFFGLIWQGVRITQPGRELPAGIDMPGTYTNLSHLIRQLLFVSAFYGLFSHNLYQFYWIFVFALLAILVRFDQASKRTRRVGSRDAAIQ